MTFSVYSDSRGTEKIFPFCLVPRLLGSAEWARLERGLVQRVRVIEAFLDDIYGEQRFLREPHVPADLILGAKGYEPKLRGVRPPGGVRVHVGGIDLIRDPAQSLQRASAVCQSACEPAGLRGSPGGRGRRPDRL